MTRGTDVTDFQRTYRTARTEEFPETLQLELVRQASLRYGENPNQPGAIYHFKDSTLAPLVNIRLAKTGKAGLSATNYMDITRALQVLKFFTQPAVAVMKHLIPSGFAKQVDGESLDELYKKARDADARSAFGSVVVFNRRVDAAAATELMTTYVEGVAAPSFTADALKILGEKQDLRLILYDHLDRIPKFTSSLIQGRVNRMQIPELKGLPTESVLAQAPYLSSIRSPRDLIVDPLVRTPDGKSFVVKRNPTPRELDDMITAWYVNVGAVRSNGIVIVKNGVTLAVSSGRTERVGAVEQGLVQGYQKAMDQAGIKYNPLNGARERHRLKHNPLEGAVLSSDAFFPKPDSIELLGRCGISAIIQPGGSKRDSEIIAAANKYKMAMAFTLERCFGHF
ncbi:IMP cyclohydrolase [Candidatus Woesearchaeota archaeon]|nr:IMP cyclohydrolase [Candidatus Woesearchaeota archaeon]